MLHGSQALSLEVSDTDVHAMQAAQQNAAVDAEELPYKWLWFLAGAGGVGLYWYYYLRKGSRR